MNSGPKVVEDMFQQDDESPLSPYILVTDEIEEEQAVQSNIPDSTDFHAFGNRFVLCEYSGITVQLISPKFIINDRMMLANNTMCVLTHIMMLPFIVFVL